MDIQRRKLLMNLAELQDIAYTTATRQGLYSHTNNDTLSCISLIIAEVYELVDAFKKNRIADIDEFKKALNRKFFKRPFKKVYEKFVKDTLQDEFADVLIIIASLAKHSDITLSEEAVNKEWYRNFNNHTIENNAYAFAKNATRSHRKGGVEIKLDERLNFLFAFTVEWAASLGVDIDFFVANKLEYNKTRGYLHQG